MHIYANLMKTGHIINDYARECKRFMTYVMYSHAECHSVIQKSLVHSRIVLNAWCES